MMKKLMKKVMVTSVLIAWSIFWASSAQAVLLSFQPVSQNAQISDVVNVDVVVSGLGNGVAPSLGDFDLDVSYDNSILNATGGSIGPFLGDPGLGEAITFSNLLPGVVDFGEVSLLFDFELNALQADTFTLATLTFDAIGVGTSALNFTKTIMGDAFGQPLPVTTSSGEVIVSAPTPATLVLLGVGLMGLAVSGSRKQNS